MKVSFIQFETAEKASEVRQSIIAGQITFENAAKQFSTDRYTKENGGKLRDWVQRTQTPFSQAAFGLLQDGDVSDVVEYPGLGYFLIRRNSYVRNYQIDFDEVKDDLKALMIQELTQRLAAAKQDELMKAADIKIVVQWPEGSVVPSREAVVPPAPPR
jgi:parvulin-like peptidyl-prolyl isomerase